MNKWQEIWNKRILPDGEAVLDRLIQADGFDSGAGKISADSWEKYAGFIAERIGIKQGDSLFELGCGSGAFLYLFYETGHKVGGIDYSDSLIKIACEVMGNMDFEVCEAINIKTENKYDFVLSNSVFHYFPDLQYAEVVINKMLEKSNIGTAILEVPNLALKEESEKARRGALSPGEYEEKYKGLNHLYYDKAWFYETGKKHNCTVEIFDQNIEDYGNNTFRFNVIMTKNG